MPDLPPDEMKDESLSLLLQDRLHRLNERTHLLKAVLEKTSRQLQTSPDGREDHATPRDPAAEPHEASQYDWGDLLAYSTSPFVPQPGKAAPQEPAKNAGRSESTAPPEPARSDRDVFENSLLAATRAAARQMAKEISEEVVLAPPLTPRRLRQKRSSSSPLLSRPWRMAALLSLSVLSILLLYYGVWRNMTGGTDPNPGHFTKQKEKEVKDKSSSRSGPPLLPHIALYYGPTIDPEPPEQTAAIDRGGARMRDASHSPRRAIRSPQHAPLAVAVRRSSAGSMAASRKHRPVRLHIRRTIPQEIEPSAPRVQVAERLQPETSGGFSEGDSAETQAASNRPSRDFQTNIARALNTLDKMQHVLASMDRHTKHD